MASDCQADWYFDFISPYSYLQSERIEAFPATVRPKPVLFAGLLGHWGQKGPAEMQTKREFTYRQIVWVARRDGIALRFPPKHPFNPIRALRLAIALDCDMRAIHVIFRHIWAEGGEVDADEGFASLCEKLKVKDGEARIAAAEVKDRLRRNGEEALAAGVFGVPTLAIDRRLFWGYDATAMALDYVRDPVAFESGEMARIADLPVGAARK